MEGYLIKALSLPIGSVEHFVLSATNAFASAVAIDAVDQYLTNGEIDLTRLLAVGFGAALLNSIFFVLQYGNPFENSKRSKALAQYNGNNTNNTKTPSDDDIVLYEIRDKDGKIVYLPGGADVELSGDVTPIYAKDFLQKHGGQILQINGDMLWISDIDEFGQRTFMNFTNGKFIKVDQNEFNALLAQYGFSNQTQKYIGDGFSGPQFNIGIGNDSDSINVIYIPPTTGSGNLLDDYAKAGIAYDDAIRLAQWDNPPSPQDYLNMSLVYDDPHIYNQLTGQRQNSYMVEPTLPKGSNPINDEPKIDPKADDTERLGINRQIESAELLASEGYEIVHLSDDKLYGNEFGIKKGTNPDYLIGQKVFDAYAPQRNPFTKIRTGIKGKVGIQTNNLVINLDNPGISRSAEDLLSYLTNKPVAGLEEIFIIKDGKILHHLF